MNLERIICIKSNFTWYLFVLVQAIRSVLVQHHHRRQIGRTNEMKTPNIKIMMNSLKEMLIFSIVFIITWKGPEPNQQISSYLISEKSIDLSDAISFRHRSGTFPQIFQTNFSSLMFVSNSGFRCHFAYHIFRTLSASNFSFFFPVITLFW